MKIIAGKFKGKLIPYDESLPARPTKNIAKQAIFNYIESQFDWNNISLLDLFAGTGNIGLEALSRGAKQVYFVDNAKNCQKYILKILKEWQITNAHFLLKDYLKFIQETSLTFDIIFLDPPYQKIPLHIIMPKLLNLLNPEGLVILEHLSSDSFTSWNGFQEKKVYGLSAFSIFKN